jgi:maltose alpha-D-glucosyltransferase/alpha-amylase
MNRRTVLKGLSLTTVLSSINNSLGLSTKALALAASSETSPANPSGPAWLQSTVFYQVYPQSFCDSDNDGTGDLLGLTSKLDYIRSIGCNAVWLNPIFESPFGDAGYDVADFLRVASRYGSNEDVRNLCREAHKREMKICLDLVAGHTSVQHPWFRQAVMKERNQFSDWYIWMPPSEEVPNSFPVPDEPGVELRPENYLANFFSFQPALNYGYFQPDPSKPWQRSIHDPVCRAVQENLRDVMKFWLDLGVDGFRVDMASSLIRNDPDHKGIQLLWQGYRKWLNTNYPEAILISEWGCPAKSIPAGFDVDFLLHFGDPAYIDLVGPRNPPDGDSRKPDAFFERSGKGDITRFLDNYLANYEPTKGLGYISLPTGNHDFPRVTWGRTEAEVRVLFAMLFTMPGVPFLYYGDEIGMRFLLDTPEKEGANRAGLRAGSRTPMQWSDEANAGFSGAPKGDLYLPIDPNVNRPNVAAQQDAPDSILNFTRSLLRLRRERRPLANTGGFDVVHAQPGGVPFVYRRISADQQVLVAINPTASPCSVLLSSVTTAKPLLVQNAQLRAGMLEMGPISFGIFSAE